MLCSGDWTIGTSEVEAGKTKSELDAVVVATGLSNGNSGLKTEVPEATLNVGASCLNATENLIVARTGSDPSGISPWKLPQ